MRRSVLASIVLVALVGSATAVSAAPVTVARPAIALALALDDAAAEPIRYRYRSFRGFRSHSFRGFHGRRSFGFHRGFGFRRNPFVSPR